MYNGIINIDNLDKNEILELLEACDELCFDELIDDLQNHLIDEKNDWILENLNYMHQFSSKYQSSFNILHNYFDDLLKYTPTIFLKSKEVFSALNP